MPAVAKLVLASCALASACAVQGPPGEAGAQGPEGPRGAAGSGGLVSGSRLRVWSWVGVDGTRIPQGGPIHDTVRDAYCTPAIAADGRYRCLPSVAGTIGSYFADAACTVELADRKPYLIGSTVMQATWPDLPAARLQDARKATTPSALTPGPVKIYRVGAEHVGPLYYKSSSTACAAVTPDPGDKYDLLGAEVAAADFVEMALAAQ